MTVGIKTKKMTLVQAVTDAMRTMLAEHDDVIVLGEDVGKNGGVFRATDGLYEQFGEDRVIDTPLAESGIVGELTDKDLELLRMTIETYVKKGKEFKNMHEKFDR